MPEPLLHQGCKLEHFVLVRGSMKGDICSCKCTEQVQAQPEEAAERRHWHISASYAATFSAEGVRAWNHLIIAGTSCISFAFSVRIGVCRRSLLLRACVSKDALAPTRSALALRWLSEEDLGLGPTFNAAAAAAAAPAGALNGADAPEPKPRMGCSAPLAGSPWLPRNSGPTLPELPGLAPGPA